MVNGQVDGDGWAGDDEAEGQSSVEFGVTGTFLVAREHRRLLPWGAVALSMPAEDDELDFSMM